jgi:hypothetical protein
LSQQRKQVPLRLDPAVYDALARWAADDLRSVNAQIEVLLREALRGAGRLPAAARPIATRSRSADEPGRSEVRDEVVGSAEPNRSVAGDVAQRPALETGPES